MEEEKIEILDENIQTTFNEASMEELVGDAIIENNVNEENIEEVEDGD